MPSSRRKSQKLIASFGQKAPHRVHWGSCVYDHIPLLVGVTEDGALCRLAFAKAGAARSVPPAWAKAWKRTEFIRDPKAVAPVAEAIAKAKDLKVKIIGTAFQCDVWQNLLNVPSGEVVSYGELARRTKRPRAVRAVGTACGANPVAILVPCHRVIAGDGSLGGFGGSLALKKKLLKKEGKII